MKTNYWPVFDDMASMTIMSMEDFHDYTMMILFMITLFLSTFLIRLMISSFKNTFLLEGQVLELIWTILPIFILFFIAYPSLFYLYFSDMSLNPSMTLKVFGIQWYWMYEYSDYQMMTFSSYMIQDKEILDNKLLSKSGWRLLESDTRAILPYNSEIRIMVTSQDVIHSFSIPSLSVKIDAIPGRLNWTTIFVKRPGTYFGQCAEICGVGHSFMPISVDFISKKDFFETMKSLNKEMS